MSTRWGKCSEVDPSGRYCRFGLGHKGPHEVGDHSVHDPAPPIAAMGSAYAAVHRNAPVSSMATPGEQALAEAQGDGGYIWVFPNKVRIKHSGLRGALTVGVLKGDKELQIDQISGIQWRDAGLMWLGHIQFTLIGGSSDSRLAAKDENALQFDKAKQPAFEVVRAAVDGLMSEAREARRPMPPPASIAAPAVDIPDQIRKLAGLRDAGLLTGSEFELKKAELLARM